MKGTQRKFHIHRFPRVQGGDRVKARKTQNAIRVIKCEPVERLLCPRKRTSKGVAVTMPFSDSLTRLSADWPFFT
jgi:hypothetical protein